VLTPRPRRSSPGGSLALPLLVLALAAAGLFLMLGVSRPPAGGTHAPVLAAGVTIEPPLGRPTARPRMVEFFAPGCAACRRMSPVVAVIERDCDGKRIDVVMVDASRPSNASLVRDYQISGVPTFVFLDRKGRAAARLVGYQPLSSLHHALAVLVGESCDGLRVFTPEEGSCARASSAARCSPGG
jgi:thiol-disulfide isomerase/thioredoxin